MSNELRNYLTEREMERLMAPPRRDRDLTKPKPRRQSVSRQSQPAQHKVPALSGKTKPVPKPLPRDPSAMSFSNFLLFTADEAKGEVDTEEAKLLRQPAVGERWYRALGLLLAHVNSELSVKGGGQHRSEQEYRRWREAAIGYKTTLEQRRAEASEFAKATKQARHESLMERQAKAYRQMLIQVSRWLEGEEAFVYRYWPERDELKNQIDDLLWPTRNEQKEAS